MSSDRELLELAAKAAGIDARWVDGATEFNYTGFLCKTEAKHASGFPVELHWNPLTDDCDALRLAVKLGMLIDARYTNLTLRRFNEVMYWPETTTGISIRFDEHADPFAATRRAIVRAAAEIGKSMP